MTRSIKTKLETIDKDHFSLLVDIGKIAKEENLKAYLVGGMVRDLLLGFNNLDIDIVIESNAHKLANALVSRFSNCELSAKHDRFHTAKIIFTIDGKKISIDLASTREETYEHPAALPTVNVSDLQKDLYRRDFTINALAVSLLPDDFGKIVDLFSGLNDLENKKIKILHDLSFIDDPTRIIRAVRFAVKLGFEIEEHTKKLLFEAINSEQFDNLIEKIRGDRVKIEIRYLLNLPSIQEAIKEFYNSGIHRMVSTSLRSNDKLLNLKLDKKHKSENSWLLYLGIILKDLNNTDQEQIMKNLQMTNDEIKIITNGLKAYKILEISENTNSITLFKTLKELSSESILITKLLFSTNNKILALIDEYIEKTSKIKLEITGQDLILMGLTEGRKLGETLNLILEMKIKNPNMKKEDEIAQAKILLMNH